MFKRNAASPQEKPEPDVQRTSAVNGVFFDPAELSAALNVINKYKVAFGHHMEFRVEGGRLKIDIKLGDTK